MNQELADMTTTTIRQFGAYDSMANNCQDFAVYLFLKAADIIKEAPNLISMLSKDRSSPLIALFKSAAPIREPLLEMRIEIISTERPTPKEDQWADNFGGRNMFELLRVWHRGDMRPVFEFILRDWIELDDDESGEKMMNLQLFGRDKFRGLGNGNFQGNRDANKVIMTEEGDNRYARTLAICRERFE